MSQVVVREGETFDSLLRRFNKRVQMDGILSEGNGGLPSELLVDRAFDQLAMTAVSDESRSALIEFVEEQDRLEGAVDQSPRERAVNVLKMAATVPEFQRA